jgi:hypothetical protein
LLIAPNALAMQAAWLLISGGDGLTDAKALASMFLDLHKAMAVTSACVFWINSLIIGGVGLEVGAIRARLRCRHGDRRLGLSGGKFSALLRATAFIRVRPGLTEYEVALIEEANESDGSPPD